MRLYTGQRNRLAWLFRHRELGQDNVIVCDDKELEELRFGVASRLEAAPSWPSSDDSKIAAADADRRARLSRMAEALRWPS